MCEPGELLLPAGEEDDGVRRRVSCLVAIRKAIHHKDAKSTKKDREDRQDRFTAEDAELWGRRCGTAGGVGFEAAQSMCRQAWLCKPGAEELAKNASRSQSRA